MFKIFALVCFLFFILYDYYHLGLGGKPFDYLGIILLIFALLFMKHKKRHFNFNRHLPVYKIVYFINCFIWLTMGGIGLAVEHNFLSVFSFFCGCFIILPACFYLGKKYQSELNDLFSILLFISTTAFLIQYLTFKFSGHIVNFHDFLEFTQPRVYNAGLDFFRGSGFYQEPSEYAKGSFFILTIRSFLNRKNSFDILALINLFTFVLCQSLWGLGLFFFYIFFYSNFFFLKLSIAATILLTIFTIQQNPTILIANGLISEITVRRITDPGNDSSTQARLGTKIDREINIFTFTGHGLSTSKFQDYSGANGLSFYIYSFGFIGFIIFLFSLYLLKRDENSSLLMVSMLYLLTAFPHFTYMVTWAWLGLCSSQIVFYNSRTIKKGFKSQQIF